MPFTQETLHFLFENRLQNSKAWFEDHKPEYQQFVINPLIELVKELTPTILSIDERLICEPKVGKCISRIYRDTRFSKDKSLYRDLMWMVFVRDKKLYYGMPGFFFEVSTSGFSFGCGFYEAGTQTMNSLRQLILSNHISLQKALTAYENQDLFNLSGDVYKKNRYPDSPEKLGAWLNRKNIAFIHESNNFDLLFDKKLASYLACGYKILEPIYNFLINTVSL